MKRLLVCRFVTFAVLSTSAACVDGAVAVGSDDPALGLSAPPDGDACETFCAAATEVGCPPQGDCLEICADLRTEAPACDAELDALLECAAVWLDPATCRYRQPYDVLTCIDLMDDYDICAWDDEDSVGSAIEGSCESRISVPGGAPGAIRSEPLACDLGFVEVVIQVECRGRGVCDCTIDGETVHTCTNLLNESDFSSASRGCCAEFFGDIIGW